MFTIFKKPNIGRLIYARSLLFLSFRRNLFRSQGKDVFSASDLRFKKDASSMTIGGFLCTLLWRFLAICFITILGFQDGQAQTAWVKIDSGAALYLNPLTSEWVPIDGKEKIPLKTFLLTKPKASSMLFVETEVITLPENAYFYLEDALPRRQTQIVAALTRIEAEQLPENVSEPDSSARRRFGLTYGRKAKTAVEQKTIPFEQERLRAVDWFYAQNRPDASVVCLKRMLAKYPALYHNASYVERLFSLYEKLELYGFLLDESRRLTQSARMGELAKKWQSIARERLAQIRKK